VAVIETDEAAFPEIVRQLQPRVILLNNLFRDQLDRYGELNTVATKWGAAVARLSEHTTVVVNADDPTLAEITRDLGAPRRLFGIAESRYQLAELPHAADSAVCRRCGTDLTYDALYVSHLGEWRCPRCSAKRPALDFAGSDVELDGVEALKVRVQDQHGSLDLGVGIPGLYNVYNVIAAAAVARTLGISGRTIAWALSEFRAAFGRIERVPLHGRSLTLALVKNPVGCNEVLRMLTAAAGTLATPALIAINDQHADGRDVSWLWDVDFELLAAGEAPLSTAGIRGPDMANRLKYAGVDPLRITPLPADLKTALDEFVTSLPEGGTGYVLATYTAMLDLRDILADLGAVERFWEQ
jgi:UDP-N-acetylmuramyl tripeptide synthase